MPVAESGPPGGPFRFRLSDAIDIPLRGWLFRLKVLKGRPSVKDLQPGRSLRLRAPEEPEGSGRIVPIEGLSETAGRQTQDRLDRLGEWDIVVPQDVIEGLGSLHIGWLLEGPVARGKQ